MNICNSEWNNFNILQVFKSTEKKIRNNYKQCVNGLLIETLCSFWLIHCSSSSRKRLLLVTSRDDLNAAEKMGVKSGFFVDRLGN